MAYQISLEVFQGPLDVLLALIENGKLEITTVSLAAVADQYLQYMVSLPQPDLDLMCDFLVVAAKLLLIKSRSLLPQPELADDDEDPGRQLVDQLAEYRRFKEAAAALDRFAQLGRGYPRQSPAPVVVSTVDRPISLDGLTMDALAAAMRRALGRRPAEDERSILARPKITLEEKIGLVEEALLEGPTTFAALVDDAQSTYEVVVTFVAILEMFRQGRLVIGQNVAFGEITIEREWAVGTPAVSAE